jgi:UDPglucose 6-dehydrogenase
VQQGADATVICNGWQHFRAPDFDTIKPSLNHPLIFDGRNLYDPALLEILGIDYHAIGRSAFVQIQ